MTSKIKHPNSKTRSNSLSRAAFLLFKKVYLLKLKISKFSLNTKKKLDSKTNKSIQFNKLNKFFFFFFLNFSKNKISKLFSTFKPGIFPKKKKKKTKLITIFKFAFAFCLVLVIFSSVFFYFTFLKDLPNPDKLSTRSQILSTKIYDRYGNLLYKIYRNQNRSLTNLDQLPPHLINATISGEDANFWHHHGFSVKGILRALNQNLQNDYYAQGGSTITQQLVKNSLLTQDKSLIRKIKELILSIEVEMLFTKQEILQMYFNEIPYGGVNYGIAEASQSYFGKQAKDLNLAEAALLAGIPTAPTLYSPYGAHPEYAIARQHYVLDRMVIDGYISSAEAEQAKNTQIVLKPQVSQITAPHFVMYVKDLLEAKYGTRMVEEGGLEVYTSLDLGVQNLAQQAVINELDSLYNQGISNVTNGAVLVTKPNTGEILAMVGSYNYYNQERDGNVNLTTSLRQPGSSIKPVVYSIALENGFRPYTLIDDSPVSYPDGDHFYAPVNYDGKFHGLTPLRTALASSFNIPAVKLTDKFGVDAVINAGKRFGISTWEERNRFGLSISLGGGEIYMTEMATVYGVFANSGLKVDLNPILQVKDANGKILNDFYCNKGKNFIDELNNDNLFCNPKTVLSPIVAWQISDILSDNIARTPGFSPYSLLKIDGHQVAVKTGTTDSKKDNWAIGYTPDYVTAVWVGNNDNTPMSAVASGITGATPIWHNVMADLVKSDSPEVFKPPKGLNAVQICADNGLLPCASCRNLKTEYFIPGTEPTMHCVNIPLPSPSPKP